MTPANAQDRAQVGPLADAAQVAPGDTVELTWVDQGTRGRRDAVDADARGIAMVVRLPETKQGFVLLPRQLVMERSFAWATRFRRLARDYERLAQTVAGLHVVALACLMLDDRSLLPFGSP